MVQIGYKVERQKGSHIRLSKNYSDGTHHITIPNHTSIKIGTLNSILIDLAVKMKTSKEEIIQLLFG